MSDEQNQPDLAAIEAQVRAKLEAEFNEEKNKIIGNRDQILEEKKALESKYKGFDQEKIEGYQKYLKELENNEEMRLMSEGKIDEVIQRKMSGREKAWSETQAEYEERLSASQSQAEEYKAKLEQMAEKNTGMLKRQFLKELTQGDASFEHDYYNEFLELQSKYIDIDESNGAAYALDDQGKRKVDTDGNLVKFEDYYNKLKVTNGLFFKSGSGSGIRGGSGGDMLGGNPDNWTGQQKVEYIQQNGRAAFAKLIAESKRK